MNENEQENNSSVLDADGRSPAREALSMDSIETPVDVIHHRSVQGIDLPFVARSSGKYREGRGFSYYREGFDGYCFFLTVSGAGEVTYRSETRRMERSDMIFVSSTLPARTVSLTDDWRFYFVNIAGAYCEQYERLWNNGGFAVIRPRDAIHYTALLDDITAELQKSDLSSELTVNYLVTKLLTDALNEIYRGEGQPVGKLYPAWVQEVATLLSGSDLSLSEIAARCGFASHSFFSKTFKRLYGVTPTEYRQGLLKT